MAKILIAKRGMNTRGNEYYVRDDTHDFHCADGMVKKEELQKGGMVTTNTGGEFYVLEATFLDQYKRMKRLAQIIPRKDIGLVITETGIGKKSIVLDMGAGSGAVALLLAQFVKKVITYEIREDHFNLVKKNCLDFGVKNVVVKKHDVYTGLPDKNSDLIIIDLPEPWKMLDHAQKSVKLNHFVVSYSPTIPQVMDFVAAVAEHEGFVHEKTIEILLREWEVDQRKVRPQSQMMGHSGFLTFARRVA